MVEKMTLEQYERWMDECGRYIEPSDKIVYDRICSLLPLLDNGHPACGPHNYPAMRLFMEQVRPSTLLEIGFNLGHSAAFLGPFVHRMTSVDIREDEHVKNAVSAIWEFLIDFSFVLGPSQKVVPGLNQQFDAAFIDGGHEYNDVVGDLKACIGLGIVHFLMDDWLSIYGGVAAACKDLGLRVVWTCGNMAYVRN